MKIIVFGTACWTLCKFRGSLLRKLASEGHQIITIGADSDVDSIVFLDSIGVEYYEVNFDRDRFDIISLFISFYAICKIFNNFKPDACLAYFLKPIFISSCLKLFFKFHLVSLVEGLGFSFMKPKYSPLRIFAKHIVRFCVLVSEKVIFLNLNDKDEISLDSKLGDDQKISILPGIGVDLDYYKFSPMPRGEIKFLFLSRLLKAKGIEEFCNAAAQAKTEGLNASFFVYGQIDDSSLGVPAETLRKLDSDGIINYGGTVHDVRNVLKESHVLVLPTYYREGLPRCIQEAMAIGRPVITTNSSGCYGIIKNEENGFIIKEKSKISLMHAVKWFCLNKDSFIFMSKESRKSAECHFDCNKSDYLLKIFLIT